MPQEHDDTTSRWIEGFGFFPNRIRTSQIIVDGAELGPSEPRVRILKPDGTDAISVDAQGAISGLAGGASFPGVMSDQARGLSIENALGAGALATGAVPVSLLGTAPDPAYHPVHTYTADDLTTVDSWYGAGAVTFLAWTPTESGTLFLLPPEDNGSLTEIDSFLFAGSVIGDDVPSRDATGGNPSWLAYARGQRVGAAWHVAPSSTVVTAGHPYTLALFQSADDYFTASTTLGYSVSLVPWIRSTQRLGGQATHVVWHATAPGYLAHAEGSGGIASGDSSHVEGFFTNASGSSSHAEGGGSAALGSFAHAEGSFTNASGEDSHAEGNGSVASGAFSHAEGGSSAASGSFAHAEGGTSVASGTSSHAEGSFTNASGSFAHAEGNGSAASGTSSHAEGISGLASGFASHAEGIFALAATTSEHSSGSGKFSRLGDAQYSRLVTMAETSDATSTLLDVGNGTIVAPAANETWTIEALVCAARADVPGTVAGWRLTGLVTTTGGALRIVGTPESVTWSDGGSSSWTAALDTTGGFIRVAVTGEAAKTIRWVATLHITKVGV